MRIREPRSAEFLCERHVLFIEVLIFLVTDVGGFVAEDEHRKGEGCCREHAGMY